MIIRDLRRTWVISDHHFGHANIIKYTDRPFGSVAEMDMAMIERHNEVVSNEDTVFFLGDITFSFNQLLFYLSALNGKKYIVPGNHDKWQTDYDPGLLESKTGTVVLSHIHELILKEGRYRRAGYDKFVTLCHYPLESWDKKYHGSWHLFGHVHNNRPNLEYQLGLAKNVCVEMTGYRPVSLYEVGELLLQRESPLVQ